MPNSGKINLEKFDIIYILFHIISLNSDSRVYTYNQHIKKSLHPENDE